MKLKIRFTGATQPAGYLRTFLVALTLSWGIGACAYVYFFPLLMYHRLERIIVQRGLETGSGGIPVNTLYAMPDLASPGTSKSDLIVTGTNHDTLYTIGWLDLGKGSQVLHVPDMGRRYYSVEFVDLWGDVFAYVGRRTTNTRAGDFLISGPGWRGAVPEGTRQISSPSNTVLLIGRVLVESDNDVATAYSLEQQIRLTRLTRWRHAQ